MFFSVTALLKNDYVLVFEIVEADIQCSITPELSLVTISSGFIEVLYDITLQQVTSLAVLVFVNPGFVFNLVPVGPTSFLGPQSAV